MEVEGGKTMECINKYFIEKGTLKDIREFDEDILKQKGIVYEVFRVVDGIPMFLENHLDRITNSLSILGKKMPYSREEIKKQIKNLIIKNDVKIGNIKLLYDSLSDEKNLIAYFIKHSYPTKEMYEEGIRTILYFGERENPNAKIINQSFREGVNEAIKTNNAYEAILINNEGYVTEGSRSNIFMVKGDTLITSPVKAVLPGVTRGTIIDLCEKNNIKVVEKEVRYDEIKDMDGLFMSGTSPKILPINFVNDYRFDSGKNIIVKNLIKIFDENMKKYINSNKEFYL